MSRCPPRKTSVSAQAQHGSLRHNPLAAGKWLFVLFFSLFLAGCIPPPVEVRGDTVVFVSTLAGTAGVSGSVDDTGAAAKFNYPHGVAVDAAGNVYVADMNNHTIRKITAAGGVSTLAGTAGTFGNADGTGAAAKFNYPHGVAVDAAGNVYVADAGNHTIRKITAAGGVTTLAGTAGAAGSADGTGAAAKFNYPSRLLKYLLRQRSS